MKNNLRSTTALCHPEICRDPVSLGTAILGGLGISGASAALTTIVGYAAGFAINLVASYALQALQQRDIGGKDEGRLVNARSSIAPEEYVYGQIRKGGTVTYIEGTGDKNKYLHMIVVLAAHECEEIGDIYINDEIVSLDVDGFVTGDRWDRNIRIKKHDGSQTVADPDLLAESNIIDANFVGRGKAYLYVRLRNDREAFTGGVPSITAVVKGKRVFDPRDGQTRWTRNLALNLRDYLGATYGVKADTSVLSNVIWQTAANVCDEDVALNGGGTEKRYTSDVIIKSTETRRSVLNKFMACSAGTLWYGNEWLFKPGYFTSAVGDLSINDLRGPIKVNPRPRRRQRFNIVHGTFVSAVDDYVDTDFPEVRNTTYLAEDNAVERYLNLELPYTSSNATAQRIADQTLNRSREGITFTAPFKFAKAVEYTVGDVVRFTEAAYGWSNKEFEIKKWDFRFARDKTPEVEMVLQETSSAAFAWGNNETIISGNNTSLPSFNVVPAPTLDTISTQLLRLQGGSELPTLVFDWTQDGDPAEVDHYVVEWRDNFSFADNGGVVTQSDLVDQRMEDIYAIYIDVLKREPDVNGFTFYHLSALTISEIRGAIEASSEALNPVAFTQSVTTDELQHRITGVSIGSGIDIRVRARNGLGRFSAPTIRSHLVTDDTEALPPPTAISSAVTGFLVRLDFTRPTTYTTSGLPAYDFSEIEVWRHTTNSLALDVDGEPTQGSRVGATSDDFFPDTVPADDTTYYYFLRSIDFSGNKGDFSSAQTVVVPEDTTSGESVAVVPVYKRQVSTPSTPSGGSYNFSSKVLTPPSGWSVLVPSGTSPLWVSFATASVPGTTGVDSSLTWSSPRILAQNGEDGEDGIDGTNGTNGVDGTNGTDGVDGVDGIDAITSSVTPRTANTITKSAAGVYSATFVRFDVTFYEGSTIVAQDRFRLDRSGDSWSGSVANESHPTEINPSRLSTSVDIDGQNAVVTITYSFNGRTAVTSFPMIIVIDGQDGDEGAVGDTGDTVVTGLVYFQTLQSSAPGTPSATSFNTSTGAFSDLTSGWATTQPEIEITDTSVKEWKSFFTVIIDGELGTQTINFSTPEGAIQVAGDIESDTFVSGSAGWRFQRNGDLEANDAIFRGNIIAANATITGTFDGPDAITEDTIVNAGDAYSNFGATGNGGYQNEVNVTVTFDGPTKVAIFWQMVQDFASTGDDWGYRIRVGGTTSSGGTVIDSYTGLADLAEHAGGVSLYDVAAGTHTFRFDSWGAGSNVNVDEIRLVVFGGY